jgi:hypothetical protein
MVGLLLLLSAEADSTLPRGYPLSQTVARGTRIGGVAMVALSGGAFVMRDRSTGGDDPLNVIGTTFLALGGAGYGACSILHGVSTTTGSGLLREGGYDATAIPGVASIVLSGASVVALGGGIALDHGALTRAGLAMSATGWVAGMTQSIVNRGAVAEGPVSLLVTPAVTGLALRW